MNIVPLDELEHGAYYWGECRNGTVARWDASRKEFVHWRTKFGGTFTETIGYWTEGHVLDEFKPYGKLENPSIEIPLEGEQP